MRKLLTAVVAGALAASLGTPAFGDSKAAKRSADQITATRDSEGGHYAGRDGGRSRRNYGSSYDYGSYADGGGYSDRSSSRRRANARQRECNDAYSYDRVFYDRYCRDGSAGRFRYRSSDGYPDQTSAPADKPAPSADPVAPAPDQTASPAPGHNAPPAADSPSAQPQSPPAGPSSPSPRPPGSDRFRNPDPASRPTWGGYGTGAPGPAGPAGPVGGSY